MNRDPEIAYDRWQLANEAYLARRLAWLRARLEGASGNREACEAPQANDSASGAAASDAAANGEPGASAKNEPCAALELLSQGLGLSPFERDVLLLCAAMEFDPRVARLCAEAQGDMHRPYPTFALAMSLLDDPAWDAMAPHRPLRRLQLLDPAPSGATPLTAAPLRADERIVSFIKGLNYLDDRLAMLLTPVDAEGDSMAPSQQDVVDSLTAELRAEAASVSTPIVELIGADGASKQAVAVRVAQEFGLTLYRLPAELVPGDFTELETLVRLWEREHRLLPIALLVDARECDATALGSAFTPVNRMLSRVEGLVFLDVAQQRVLLGRRALFIDVAKPTPLEQRALWNELTGDATGAAQLSAQFSLNVPDMRRLAVKAAGDAAALWTACCRATRPQLDSLAQRIDAKATWDDLVLPEEPLSQLREIASQVRRRSVVYDDWGFRERCNRGLGISVLFAGESGTGKTMAAEVIANDLRLDLYRIDLSAVVNKYIGETEKNLRKLFDAADDGGAILLFDEADALFGKRTEVKDSHDRYANLEVNYLLQRMEAYRGLAILATNLKGSLDRAFLRRLRFVVDFPLPDAAHRSALWRLAYPADVPLGDMENGQLASWRITGASIRSIALDSAFVAARDERAVEMPALVDASRREFRKLGRPFVSG
jgi:hypothetical protein